MSSDDGQLVGRVLLLVGLLLVVVGFGVCVYVTFTGWFDSQDPLGRDGAADSSLVLLGFAAVVGGGLLAALGGLVARSVRRPGAHHSYGAYAELDDDDGDDW